MSVDNTDERKDEFRDPAAIRADVFRTLDRLRDAPGGRVPSYFYPMIKSYINQRVIPEEHLERLANQFNKTGNDAEATKFFEEIFFICKVVQSSLSEVGQNIYR